ncbi:MAG TPA: fatty acyl-AMP ligase [Pyrinomonadaceae bacterium]|jgi:acyl-CoA synthetase (AMP-forming)/AMP-acid ligase II|nr:fatty acyl-AMP ligase [Pyrinomonadaceae bacterium]
MPVSNVCFSELDQASYTFVDAMRLRAKQQPNKVACTFLVDGETEEVSLTYGELDRQARGVAAKLQLLETSGQTALLLYPYGLEFIAAFLGCLYGGVVALPAYPPLSPRQGRVITRITGIMEDAKPTVALTTSAVKNKVETLFTQISNTRPMRFLATDKVAAYLAEDWDGSPANRDATAFLQYTSGSTTTPKGVMVSHRNLIQNSSYIHHCFNTSPASRGMFWLPFYHDMGLIGGLLQTLYCGGSAVLMTPAAFLQCPFRWLQAISRAKATISGGPNFAYDLCVQKISAEQKLSLDLSSWELAFNGAEPINAETLERFAKNFESCGFRRESFYPCYGLAEATLIVSGGLKSSPPTYRSFQVSALKENQVVEDNAGSEGVSALVGCGQTVPEQTIVIADPETLVRCPADRIGEIWVSGSSVAQGYWNRPDETKQTFSAYLADTEEGPFLRTGDLGFIYDGELFVTGRIKDLIIVDGSNHYAQDLERTVEHCHAAIKQGSCAAFSLDVAGSEQLVIVAEMERRYYSRFQRQNKTTHADGDQPGALDVGEVVEAIRTAVAEQHDLRAHDVLILKSGGVAKTSSGKLQRHVCKSGYLAQSLDLFQE